MATGYRRTRQSIDFWPGYVDGLAGLLMMMLFLLLFYVLGELVYSTALQSSEEDSEKKSTVITDLLNQLTALEKDSTRLDAQILMQRQEIRELLKIQSNQTQKIETQEKQLGLLNIALEETQTSLGETITTPVSYTHLTLPTIYSV